MKYNRVTYQSVGIIWLGWHCYVALTPSMQVLLESGSSIGHNILPQEYDWICILLFEYRIQITKYKFSSTREGEYYITVHILY